MIRFCMLGLLLAFSGGFVFFVTNSEVGRPSPYLEMSYRDRVVVSAPLLTLLAGGDRYLAANLEVVRVAATGIDAAGVDTVYLVRAQKEIARLHPCHEDNYYLANGLLTWGGAAEDGTDILYRAMQCRVWDGVPGFLYAVNKSFFENDIESAVLALEESARRWPENSAPLLKLAVMLRVESFTDERLALKYLEQQRDQSRDPELTKMLEKRVTRLEGLLYLRSAKKKYELRYGQLVSLGQLVDKGYMKALPVDPVRLGYELDRGEVILRKMKIAGVDSK